MRPHGFVVLASLGVMACVIGGNLDYLRAGSAPGVLVEIRTARGRAAAGELLTVDSTGLLVLGPSKELVRVPLAVADLVEPQRGGPVWVRLPEASALRDLDQMRLMSRFPQGVSGDLLGKLLEAYGQDSVRVVQR